MNLNPLTLFPGLFIPHALASRPFRSVQHSSHVAELPLPGHAEALVSSAVLVPSLQRYANTTLQRKSEGLIIHAISWPVGLKLIMKAPLADSLPFLIGHDTLNDLSELDSEWMDDVPGHCRTCLCCCPCTEEHTPSSQ